VPQEGEPKAIIARVLVGEQTERNSGLTHEVFKSGGIESTFEEPAAGAVAEGLKETVEGWLAQAAIGGSALVGRRELAESSVKFEVTEVADGADDGTGRRRRRVGEDRHGELDAGTEGFEIHGRSFDGAGKVFANAAEVFPGERANLRGRLFVAQAEGEIAECDTAMASVETPDDEAGKTPEPSDELQRESLDTDYESVSEEV
jgi:hypothetical protein